MRTELLKEVSLFVSDVEAAERFYEDIIGLPLVHRVEGQRATLHHSKTTTLTLFQAQTASIQPAGTTSGSEELGQVSFGINPPEVSSWRKHLQNHGVSIEEVAWPNGTQSIRFRDPAGNRIELKTQLSRSQDVSTAQHSQRAISGGLHAQWKIYQAARLGVKGSPAQSP